MRFDNNNKAVINKLVGKSMRASRLRNIFAIFAVVLTTVLFTSLFTVGMGLVKSAEMQTMRQAGGYAHGSFKYLTQEEFDNIKGHPLIDDLGYSIMVSMGENEEFLKHHTEIKYATDREAKMLFCTPTKGKMPQKENEIATDTTVLDLLGVPHEVGEKLTIEYSIGEEKLSKEFVLSGFWQSDMVSPASMIFVSRELIDKNLENISVDKADKKGMGTGLITADVTFKNSFSIQQKMERVLTDSGYSSHESAPNYIPTGVNWAYMSTNFGADYSIMIAVLAMCLLIVFTGYLIIYNIFQISVVKDIRFYGLLKTIGITSKQIRKLIVKQALRLSLAGIPIGLTSGYIIGNVLLPVIVSTTSIKTSYISFNPIIFIGAALFTLITVYISCRKPGKFASKVSPVEAAKYVDVNTVKGKGEKKSLNGGKIHNMALANILRNKKKAALVVASMSLSIILFNSAVTFTNGFDMDKYLDRVAITDFTAASADYFNMNHFVSKDNVVSERMIKSISRHSGIENSGRVYYNLSQCSISRFDKETGIQLYGLEDFPLSKLNILEGKVDLEKLKTGGYIIEGIELDDNGNIPPGASRYRIGDKLTLTFEGGIVKEYQVMAKAEIFHNMSVRYYALGSSTMYLPAGEFANQIKEPLTMSYLFDVEDENIGQVERFLQEYTSTIEPQMDYESKRKYVDEFKSFQNMFLLAGGTLSLIIGVIGALNFINAVITSIISRRREFAMLQSIGMTDKQLNKMLIFEGLFYALGVIVISVIFGSLVSLVIVQPIARNIWFYSYKYLIWPILAISPVLILISAVVPLAAFTSVNKQTIVERLREAE